MSKKGSCSVECGSCRYPHSFEAVHMELFTWECPACGTENQSRVFDSNTDITVTLKFFMWHKLMSTIKDQRHRFRGDVGPIDELLTEIFRQIHTGKATKNDG